MEAGKMSITIPFWVLPVFLFVFPFAYDFFRKSGGDYDFRIDSMIVFAVCWAGGIGWLIGKYL
jgi:hypothetical protein